MAYEKNPDELGALWVKTGAKGEYMTGEINGVKVFCTPVKSAHAKAPTWRVMKSKPREAQASSAPDMDASDVPF
jgi:hypothetical protein